MSDGNLKSVRRSFDIWNRGDVEALLAGHAPDCVWDLTRLEQWPDQELWEGHDGLRRFFEQWRGAWQEYYTEPLRLESFGDRVFAHGVQRGRGRGSGAMVGVEYGQVTTFREDGLAFRNDVYSDVEQARRDAAVN